MLALSRRLQRRRLQRHFRHELVCPASPAVRRPGNPASQRKELTMKHFDVASAAALTTSGMQFDFERLDCYVVARDFVDLSTRIMIRGHREIRDQLKRASLSILLNCAEGAGRRTGVDKARFYSIARGSAMECAAIVDVMRSLGLAPVDICHDARNKLIRIVQMMTKFEARARRMK
jgi:four helix bundle protein